MRETGRICRQLTHDHTKNTRFDDPETSVLYFCGGLRKKRQSQQEFADRMGISLGTLKRLEKGEPGISIGTVAMAFLALGELERLSNVLDMTTDDTDLLLEQKNLPKRIRKPRPPKISGPDQVTTLYPDGMVF